MGFCTEKQHKRFLQVCPDIEKFMVDGGVILIKFWLEVERRAETPIRGAHRRPAAAMEAQPDGSAVASRWYHYSHARDLMLKHTDTQIAPW